MRKLVWLLALLTASVTAKDLEISVIDVEGGKAVLFVTPSGQSMLFDAGWPAFGNRKASTERLVDAAKLAGIKRIDLLVISHFDIDHIGDVPELAAQIPIGRVFDHGDLETSNAQAKARFAAYAAARDNIGHTVLKTGDKLPIKGLDIKVLSSGGDLIKGDGPANPVCGKYKQLDVLPTDAEDNRSIGLLITFGKFRMLDLADLEAHHSHGLVCPANLIGPVSLYNVNVHGQFKGIAPEMVETLRAPVMIQANGARKGADAQTWPVLKSAPGLKDIWQLHTSLNAGKDANPPDDYVANLEPTDGFQHIKITAAKNGKFTVTNTRNGFSKRYQ